MSFIADGHVHIYSSFDLARLFIDAYSRLARYGRAKSYLLFCVEANKQFEFNKIPARLQNSEVTALSTDDPTILQLKTPKVDNLFAIAGRQIVTKERLEFLALFCNEDIPDGLSVLELAEKLKNKKALLVLNWAPGKWMFSRARVVSKLLNQFAPEQLLICDTALRCIGWPEPFLVKKARNMGFKIFAGSDPFPFRNEQQRVAKYGFACSADLDYRSALTKGDLQFLGHRLWPHQTLYLLIRLALRKRFNF